MTQKLESDTSIIDPDLKTGDNEEMEMDIPIQIQSQTRKPKKLQIVQQLTSSESDIEENDEIDENEDINNPNLRN